MRFVTFLGVCVAMVLIGMPSKTLAIASSADHARVAALPIAIVAPATCSSGAVLCFDVISLNGLTSVLVEVNDVPLSLEKSPTSDPYTTAICCKVPAGTGGSPLVITAVSGSGSVVTSTVSIQ